MYSIGAISHEVQSELSLDSSGSSSGSLVDYCNQREAATFKLEDFPLSDYKRAVRQAARDRSVQLLDVLGSDILNAKSSSTDSRIQFVCALLDITAKSQILSNDTKADLVEFLIRNIPNAALIPTKLLGVCASTIAELEVTRKLPINTTLLHAITPYLLENEGANTGKFIAKDIWDGLPSESFAHKPHTWPLFRAVISHIEKNNLPAAGNIFSSLLETERLAPQAIRRTESDVSSKDTALMMVTLLLRSCLVWRWRERSTELMRFLITSCHLFPSGSGDTKSLAIPIILDSFRILLRSAQTPEHLDQCARVLSSLAHHRLSAASLNPSVAAFYKKAHVLDSSESARALFKTLHSYGAQNGVIYSPPPGQCLVWLLNYLSDKVHDTHCARQLAYQAYQGDFAIGDAHVISLLKALAQGGFLEEAEGMWRRYTGMEVPSQVTKGVATIRDKIFGSVTVLSSFVRAFSRGAERAQRLADTKNAYGSTYIDPVNAPKKSQAELLAFAHTVLGKYVESHQPLVEARRIEVTALARAYFLVGETHAAVKTMKILLQRNIIPTPQELSITLANMANLNPRRASRMLQKMLDKGIQPEAVDFSAIIHEASLRGDDMLVGALVAKARELGHEQLSNRGLHSLIQQSLRFLPAKEDERPEEEAKTLRRVLRMIKALAEAKTDTVLTPWLGTKCARACVRVNQGEMAYEFWRMLVYEKEDWDHLSQQVLRRRIIRTIQNEIGGGFISEGHGRQMISELRGKTRATVGFSGEDEMGR